MTLNNYLIFFSFYREEDNHGSYLSGRCTSSREDKGVSTENQYCTLHSLSSDEGCVKDNPINQIEDLLDNSHLQTISLDGSSLVEKKSIPADLENPAEALFLTDKEKRFMQCYDAHLQGKLSIHYFFLRTALGQWGQCSINTKTTYQSRAQNYA